jgi:hypothetical protein
MHQDLFTKEPMQQKPTALIITQKHKEQLSKNQVAFNKLTQRIEKLQKEIEKKQCQFDLAMKIYGTEYRTALHNRSAATYKLICVLWEVYQGKKLSKANQRHLKSILQEQLQQYFSICETEPDKKMQEIFSKVEGINYDKMQEEEKEEDIMLMKEMFDSMGIDTEGLDFEDPEAMAAKLAEVSEQTSAKEAESARIRDEKVQQKAAKKSKNAKQLAHEKLQAEIAEAKKKNLSTIFRQLAKLFHPDLEQDEERRLEKEILMKELTIAFEAKDMHRLLMLELKWIHKENDHLASLTDDKLKIYLEILKEQAADLEREKYALVQHPQYSVLIDSFGYGIANNPVLVVRKEANQFENIAKSIELDIALFKSDNGLRHINKMIKEWKQGETALNEEEILQMLFNDFK